MNAAPPDPTAPGRAKEPVIAYIFTTFPKLSETFLQREIEVQLQAGLDLRLHSIWGGGGTFHGKRIIHFPKWKLATLLWLGPWHLLRHPGLLRDLVRAAIRRPPSLLNFAENLISVAFALVYADYFRRLRPAHIHAVWAAGPAAAAWTLWRLNGHPFSAAGHAYDLYQDGGDGWLREKLTPALFVRTSTRMGAATLLAKGVPAHKIHLIRRGLTTLPALKPLRRNRVPLRLLCVARLVPKKGFHHQLAIYSALVDSGLDFEARIVGDGPLLKTLTAEIQRRHLQNRVHLLGSQPQTSVAEHRAWADVLIHTGIVAPDGDRDGLPNVIPEAMAAGVIVVTSPAAATTEAVTDGLTGRVALPDQPKLWTQILSELSADDIQCDRLRLGARRWVEAEFDALKNIGRLKALFFNPSP